MCASKNANASSARADARALRKHVGFLTEDVHPRRAKNPENLIRAAKYIEDHFRAAGGNPQLQWVKGSPNVIAQWGPRTNQPSSHYRRALRRVRRNRRIPDADDNASGTAGLLEIARLLQRQQLKVPVILVAYTNARFVKRAMRGAGGIDVLSFTGARATSDASDQRNYWERGWPAVMITDTAFLRNPHYHTSGDTADTLDYTRMARVVDGVFNAAVHAR